jgi:hypothetical protein
MPGQILRRLLLEGQLIRNRGSRLGFPAGGERFGCARLQLGGDPEVFLVAQQRGPLDRPLAEQRFLRVLQLFRPSRGCSGSAS